MELKQEMLKAIEELPDDASVEDGMERLYLIHKIKKGISQADNGELLSQEEARRRMEKWLRESRRTRHLTTLKRSACSSLEMHQQSQLCSPTEHSVMLIDLPPPRLGRIVPEMNDESVRGVSIHGYRLIYRLQHDQVHILTVHHGARLLHESDLDRDA